MRKTLTMHETIFYILYKRFKEGKTDHLPVFQLMGEHWCEELGKWGYVSYECTARVSEINKDNPSLLDRIYLTGKSGAKFYGYKLNPKPSVALIKDPVLKAFYFKLQPKERRVQNYLQSKADREDHERRMREAFDAL